MSTNLDWRVRGACRDEDPELFYPIGRGASARAQIAAAKAVCSRCPVTEQCLAFAIDNGETAGIWGGLDEKELAERIRARSKPHRKTRKPRVNRSGADITPQERAEQVRQMASEGLTDREIGICLGLHKKTITKIRSLHGIPPGAHVREATALEQWYEQMAASTPHGGAA